MKALTSLRFKEVIFFIGIALTISDCGKLLNSVRRDDPGAIAEYQEPRAPSIQLPDVTNSSTTPNLSPGVKRNYKNGGRATKDDFIDQSEEEGSLWSSAGQTNYYFIKNRIRNPGDIITLNVESVLYKDICEEIKQTLSFKEKVKEVGTIQEQLRSKFAQAQEAARLDKIKSGAAAPDRSQASSQKPVDGLGAPLPSASPSPPPPPLSEMEIDRLMPRASLGDVDIFSSIELKPGDTMLGEIIERYPNGNYKIRAIKRIPYKNGLPRLVTVVGVVRSSEINEDTDVVNSGKLYDYQVEAAH